MALTCRAHRGALTQTTSERSREGPPGGPGGADRDAPWGSRRAAVDGSAGPLVRALSGGLALAMFYHAIAFVASGDLCLGDVKLAGLLGLFLGWIGRATVVLRAVLPFFAAAAFAASLIAAGRAGRTSRVPFGPFTIVGALAAAALGS